MMILTLVHGINNKGNGDRQENNPVNLRKGVLFFSKGQNGNARTSKHDGQVHPRQKGSLVRKEDLTELKDPNELN